MSLSLTAYQGRAGDRNNLGAPGALSLAAQLSQQLGTALGVVGVPAPALNAGWQLELQEARSDLQWLASRFRASMLEGVPITVLTRCAAAIATLPCVVERHPEVCVVWLDAHADLNTPATTSSGYLGGMALSGPGGLWDTGFGAGLPLAAIRLVGARDLDASEAELIAQGKVMAFDVATPELARVVAESVGERPVYVHLDCDVLEPGLVPTDFQVPGGLSLDGLRSVLKALSHKNLVGVEVAECQYSFGSNLEPAPTQALLDAILPAIENLRRRP